MEITGLELEQKIKNGEKLIVELWATWCGPCKMMKPVFEKVARENSNGIQMYTMDVDQNRDTAMKLGIRSVPTIKVINGGNITQTKVGVLQEQEIKGLVQELINE
jgi:thioredoxin 1